MRGKTNDFLKVSLISSFNFLNAIKVLNRARPESSKAKKFGHWTLIACLFFYFVSKRTTRLLWKSFPITKKKREKIMSEQKLNFLQTYKQK